MYLLNKKEQLLDGIQILFHISFLITGSFFIPLFLIVFLYFKIFTTQQKVANKREQIRTAKNDQKQVGLLILQSGSDFWWGVKQFLFNFIFCFVVGRLMLLILKTALISYEDEQHEKVIAKQHSFL